MKRLCTYVHAYSNLQTRPECERDSLQCPLPELLGANPEESNTLQLRSSAVILLLESTLIIGGRIIADYPIMGWRHNVVMLCGGKNTYIPPSITKIHIRLSYDVSFLRYNSTP